MKVLVDTCVWSKVLRSEKPDPALSKLLKDLISDNRVVMIGPIFQELLSGVKNKKDFKALAEMLADFDRLPITEEVYMKAAEFYNVCKSHGMNGGHVDFLICAAAAHHNCSLLTTDADFKLFEKHLPIKILQ